MEEILIPIFGIIFCVALPIVALIIIATKTQEAKHAERMALIEKGIVPEEPEKRVNRFSALRNGLLMLGLAAGAIMGILMESLFKSWHADFIIFVMSVMGGGIAFVIYFFLARKFLEKENSAK